MQAHHPARLSVFIKINIKRSRYHGKKLFPAVFVLFCLLGISSGVYAQQSVQQQVRTPSAPEPKSYFVPKGGIFYPQSDLKDLNTGFNGEIAYGYRFHANVASAYAIPLTLTFKGIVPVSNGFELYGLAGGGGYYIHNSATFTVADVGRVSNTDHSITYGGFLGAGVTYDMTREWFGGLEGKYIVTDSPKLMTNVAGEALSSTFRLQGISGTLNIGYRF